MANLLRRIVLALAAHATFLVISTLLLLLDTVVKERIKSPDENLLLVLAVCFFIMMPWILYILVLWTMPSAIVTSVIYLAGSFLHERIALATAVLIGAIVMYVTLNSGIPDDFNFPLSTTRTVVATAIYVLSWIGVRHVVGKTAQKIENIS